MTFATTYVQVPPLTEHSGVSGMAAVPGAAWGEQPSTYPYTYPTTTWPAPTDQWEWAPPPVDPQNYSGGGMPPAAVYPTGSVPLAAPIPTHTYPPPSPGAPFDARNYAPPDPGLAPFDPRNYVPPNSTPMQYTYEPRTSESAFNNSMQLYGGGVASPVIPPASYMLSPQLSRSSSGGSYPYASASGLSRSASTREHGAWLYDRPGSWSPRFQMSRSGVGSLVPSFTRGRSFPPVDTTSRTLDERLRFSALREPAVVWDMREVFARVVFRELKRQVTSYDLTRFTTEPPTPYMKLFHARLPWFIEVSASNEVGVTFYDLLTQMQGVLSSRIKNSDFYNNELTQERREKISRAWKERCQYNQGELDQGIKKVDYLMRDCTFVGLVRDRDGLWEIKTRKV